MDKELKKLKGIADRERELTKPIRRHPFFDVDGKQQRLRPEERDRLHELELSQNRETRDGTEQRWDIIRQLSPDLRCPSCRKIILRSRSWVIRSRSASCRSCYFRRGGKGIDSSSAFTRVSEPRFVSGDIRRLRNEKGWSQKGVAAKVGCSQPFISQLERSSRGVTEPVSDALREVLGNAATLTVSDFKVDGEELLAIIVRAKLSHREVCRRAKISRTHFHRIVRGEILLVEEGTMQRIVDALAR